MRREEGLENESLENIDTSNEQGKTKPVKNSEDWKVPGQSAVLNNEREERFCLFVYLFVNV